MSSTTKKILGAAALGGVGIGGYLILKKKLGSGSSTATSNYVPGQSIQEAVENNATKFWDTGNLIGSLTTAGFIGISQQLKDNYENLEQSLTKASLLQSNYLESFKQGIIDGIAGVISTFTGGNPAGSSTTIQENTATNQAETEALLNQEVEVSEVPGSAYSREDRAQAIRNLKAALRAGVIGSAEYVQELNRILTM